MKGREPKKQAGGRGSSGNDIGGAGRGRGAGVGAAPMTSTQLASAGSQMAGRGGGRGRGMGSTGPDMGSAQPVALDQYGRAITGSPSQRGKQQSGQKDRLGREKEVAGRTEAIARPAANPVGGLIDDDEDERTAVYEAKYYEEGIWYPAALVHQTARGFMVRFYGYEDDPDQDTAHADIRKILINVTFIISGGSAERRCELQVARDTTLEHLQKQVEKATMVPCAKQRIFWQGKALTDLTSKIFRECSVKEGATMHLMIRSEQDDDMPSLDSLAARPARQPNANSGKADGASGKSKGADGKVKKAGKGKPAAASGKWWSRLDGDDVISLEPLAALEYEPFRLPAEGSDASGAGVDAYNYFDGKVLSHYLVSTGKFSHPVSRRDLTRRECEALDDYMRAHSLGEAAVVHAYDLKDDQTANGQNHLQALQDEAHSILQALFAASTSRPNQARSSAPTARQPPLPTPPARVTAAQPSRSDSWGGLVDDDEELAASSERFIQEEFWPTLPQTVPAAPPPPPAPPAPVAAEETRPRGPTPPSDPPPSAAEDEDPAVVVLGRGGEVGTQWSESAKAGLREGGAQSAKVVLERQMGGTAKDDRFDAEIEAVDALLREAGGAGEGAGEGGEEVLEGAASLEARGFTASKVTVLQSEAAERSFVEGLRRMVRGSLLMLPSLAVAIRRKEQAPRPSIHPVSGVHEMEVEVCMACPQPGSAIRFTLDGSDPRGGGATAAGGVVQTYSGPFRLGEGRFDLRAVGTKHGMADSQVVSSVLIVRRRCHKPTLNPPSGPLKHGQKIAMATKTWDFLPDCRIHFSLERVDPDGEAPSQVVQGFYDKPVPVPAEGEWAVRAVAVHPRMLQSDSVVASYTQLAPEAGAAETATPGKERHGPRRGGEVKHVGSYGFGGVAMAGAVAAMALACGFGAWMAFGDEN